ncbi:hypothetical protein EIP91_010170 [Steccherinum ochraceum]|uniref:Ras modification protein ERF4 n=1 Tax=Steccherinum ochraceum TaxID=92696 RepID=A0A4R0S3T0_9APHY|nr:hypothetical protein EIP91_010170 [Steccherinum ochraceum]
MTAATPLHVELPSSSQLKSFADSPPTPYTPRSVLSLRQNSDSASMASAKTPRSPVEPHSPHDPTSSEVNGKHAESDEGGDKPVFAEGREAAQSKDQLHAQEIELPEMNVAPPDTLPPSPPLTEMEGKDEDEAKAASQHLPEEDITNWQSSVDGRDGSYHESDLGYSTGNEVSPVDARGPSARQLGVPQDGDFASSAPQEVVHPLRLDVHPPSPPLWEVIQPPQDNNTRRTLGALSPDHAARHERTPKAATTRPLIPFSTYYFGPPPLDSAYGTTPVGHIGVHHPREIIRIERDYSGGELVQFAPIYPLELEGRITPTQFLETVNTINEILISAHSLRLVTKSHYEKEMHRLRQCIDEINKSLYNPLGLNILWPHKVAFMFLEIEYY